MSLKNKWPRLKSTTLSFLFHWGIKSLLSRKKNCPRLAFLTRCLPFHKYYDTSGLTYKHLNIQSLSLTFWPVRLSRSAQELRRQIRARAEKIEDRRRNPTGTASEQMAAAEQDVEEVRPTFTSLFTQLICIQLQWYWSEFVLVASFPPIFQSQMTKLQMRLLGRNRSRGRDHGKCFTLFTGDTWLSFTDKWHKAYISSVWVFVCALISYSKVTVKMNRFKIKITRLLSKCFEIFHSYGSFFSFLIFLVGLCQTLYIIFNNIIQTSPVGIHLALSTCSTPNVQN